MRATGAPLTISDLALDGHDLIRMGLHPGPDFAQILNDLLDFVLEDPTQNERGILEARVGASSNSDEE